MKAITLIAMTLTMLTGQVIAQERYGDWVYIRSSDPFDDSDRSAVAVINDDGRFLTFKLMDDGLNVIYSWDKYFGGDRDNDVIVRYRIDNNPPSGEQYWRMLQGNRSAYIRMNRVAGFMREARTGRRIVIEVRDPLDGERIRSEFSLNGLDRALQRLRPR